MDFIVNSLLFPVVKNFENLLRFDEVTAMSLVAPFFGTRYIYTVFRKKHPIMPNYVLDYNSGVSWSIFILFVPVERGMDTL